MSSKVLVKLDKLTPLLTDCLPYETPVLFSNRGFYKSIKTAYNDYCKEQAKEAGAGRKDFNNISLSEFMGIHFFPKDIKRFLWDSYTETKNNKWYIKGTKPYVYNSLKNQTDNRNMSLIHPICQIRICDCYYKYSDMILSNTNKSSISIRFPQKKSDYFFKKHVNLLNKIVVEDVTAEEDIKDILEGDENINFDNVPNKYFVYKKYPMLYKFYESQEYLNLEKFFSYCIKLDIKRCFESIYTHSVCWAVKDKKYAKEHTRDTNFENMLDSIMQESNWKETHGIPVGAEFSRIFAEIIFQKIDNNIEVAIENHKILKSNFRIYRYIDDFFIFVNDLRLAEEITKIIEAALLDYKLFINTAKTVKLSRPFVTNRTIAQLKLREPLDLFLKPLNNIEEFNGKLKKNSKLGASFVNSIRLIISENHVAGYDLIVYVFSAIRRGLFDLLRAFLKKQDELSIEEKKNICAYFKSIWFVIFYLFNISPRAKATYQICKIYTETVEILKKIQIEIADVNDLKDYINANLIEFFEKNNLYNLNEVLDLLWISKQLGVENKISNFRLKTICEDSFDYFSFLMILWYIGDDINYTDIKSYIFKKILVKLSKSKDLSNTETFLLVVDLLKSPFLSDDQKKQILDNVGINKHQEEVLNFIKSKEWFFEWDKKINFKSMLEIKSLQTDY